MSRIEELLQRVRREVDLRRQAGLPNVPEDDRRIRWSRNGFRIIAEIKRSSLSSGLIRPDLDLPSLAGSYEAAGAAAISVLTEKNFFGGSLEDLKAARVAVSLPLLQKDFLIHPFQVLEAKACGASFVLLIAKFLSKEELGEMLRVCSEAQMNAIVEITDAGDLQKLHEPVDFVGVNSRNLQTLEVDTGKFEMLRKSLPPDAFLVAESGIHTATMLRHVMDLGYHGALIGEHFLRAEDPASELASFVRLSQPKPRVKVCGITSVADALAAIGAGADALGFIFAESPRRIQLDVLAAIRPRIPAGILCAGVFLGHSRTEIETITRRFDLHLAQVYDDAQPDAPVWRAHRVHQPPDSSALAGKHAILWDVKAEESELPGIWRSLAQNHVFALAGGLHPGNVAQAVEICRPIWIDVARGVESRPGVKDPARLAHFMKVVR